MQKALNCANEEDTASGLNWLTKQLTLDLVEEEPQKKEHEDKGQQNEVKCYGIEDVVLFDELLEDDAWIILIFSLFYLFLTFPIF